jgi:hypothetical protein
VRHRGSDSPGGAVLPVRASLKEGKNVAMPGPLNRDPADQLRRARATHALEVSSQGAGPVVSPVHLVLFAEVQLLGRSP